MSARLLLTALLLCPAGLFADAGVGGIFATESLKAEDSGSSFPPMSRIAQESVSISTDAITEDRPERRAAAVLALGRRGSIRPVEWALKGDPHWWVRYAAAGALPKAAGCGALDALERAAVVDPVWQVRVRAMQALADFRAPSTVPTLAAALLDKDDGARAAAALALSEVGGIESVAALRRALKRETDPFHQKLLSNALGRVSSPDAPAPPAGCQGSQGLTRL